MLRMIGPRQPRNSDALPSQRMLMRRRQAMASMSRKSQLEVCGAPSTTVG